MITGYFIVVFSKNSVFSSEHIDIAKKQFAKNRHYGEVPSGEYVVVTCEVGRPEEYKIGITKIEARKVTVTKSLELLDLYYIHEEVPMATKATLMPYDGLTKHIYEDTIKIVREEGFGPWWDNAPREVKDALQVKKINGAKELKSEAEWATPGDRLRVGMTYDEVVRLLGEPSGVNPGTEMLETGPGGVVVASEKTRAQLSRTKYCMWKRPEGRYLLTIEDGKLVSIYEKP